MDDDARLFAMPEGEAVVHLVARIAHPPAVGVLFPAFGGAVSIGLANVVEQGDDGDTFRRDRVGEGRRAVLNARFDQRGVKGQERLEHVERVAAKSPRLVEMKTGRAGCLEEVGLGLQVLQQGVDAVALDVLMAAGFKRFAVAGDFLRAHGRAGVDVAGFMTTPSEWWPSILMTQGADRRTWRR